MPTRDRLSCWDIHRWSGNEGVRGFCSQLCSNSGCGASTGAGSGSFHRPADGGIHRLVTKGSMIESVTYPASCPGCGREVLNRQTCRLPHLLLLFGHSSCPERIRYQGRMGPARPWRTWNYHDLPHVLNKSGGEVISSSERVRDPSTLRAMIARIRSAQNPFAVMA